MLKKRIIGVITIKENWAVQSIGFSQYLPLGRPEYIAENLDRWGADEILLQCIDRSPNKLGPNYHVLERVARMGLSTPLIYAGGIHRAIEAIQVIKSGADRISVNALLNQCIYDTTVSHEIKNIAESLGAQALMVSMPLAVKNKEIYRLNYCDGRFTPVTPSMLDVLKTRYVSECIIIDCKNEGTPGAFNQKIIEYFPDIQLPLIALGGVSEKEQISELLSNQRINAVAIGNFLNYQEHAIDAIRRELTGCNIRKPNERPRDDSHEKFI